MSGAVYRSWGGLTCAPREVIKPADPFAFTPPPRPYLAHGAGRSYGDSCFPAEGAALVDLSHLQGVTAFDRETGAIRIGAGLRLGDLIGALRGSGWFPPVVPGTRHVTIGGAIANDIHGKNHHAAGSFGRHVRAFGLARSDGEVRTCSATDNAELFRATIGGMGLTGVILWAEIQLKRVGSPDIVQTAEPIASLADFFRKAEAANRSEYAVAWIDSLASGGALGRGAMLMGDHAAEGDGDPPAPARIGVPFHPPISPINSLSLRLSMRSTAGGRSPGLARSVSAGRRSSFRWTPCATGTASMVRAACASTRASFPWTTRSPRCAR